MTARDLFPFAFYGDPRMTVDADVVNVEHAPVTVAPIQRRDFRAIARPDNFLPHPREASDDAGPKASTATGGVISSPSPDPSSPPVDEEPTVPVVKDQPILSLLGVGPLATTGSDAPPA